MTMIIVYYIALKKRLQKANYLMEGWIGHVLYNS